MTVRVAAPPARAGRVRVERATLRWAPALVALAASGCFVDAVGQGAAGGGGSSSVGGGGGSGGAAQACNNAADCGTASECATPRCEAGLCKTDFAPEDTPCGATEACDGQGTCLHVDAAPCTAESQCLSGFCVDGVCCASSCGGACETCIAIGDVGACTAIAAGKDDDAECEPGVCDGARACAGGVEDDAKGFTSDISNVTVLSVAAASDGGFAIAGDFDGSVDFGTGPISAGTGRNAFVARFDAQGAAQNARGIGGTNDQYASSVRFDAADNMILAGRFLGTADFGGGVRTAVTSDGFVAKYAANGAWAWDRVIGDTTLNQWQEIYAAAPLSDGDVIAVGRCYLTVNFGGADTPCDLWDAMLVRLAAADGSIVASKVIPGTIDQNLWGVAVDGSDNVYVVGSSNGIANFGGGNVPSAGANDIVVASYDGSLGYRWSRVVGGSGEDVGLAVAANTAGQVAIAGMSTSDLDFGGGNMPAAGGFDAVLAVFENDGALRFARRYGDGGTQLGRGVSIDDAGNVVLVGSFDGSVDLGAGGIPSAGSLDAFVVKSSTLGIPLWGFAFGDVQVQNANAVAATADRGVIVGGDTTGSYPFGASTLSNTGPADGFWARVGP